MRILAIVALLWICTSLGSISHANRLPADLERDLRSKPEAVLRWLNLEPGDTVADIFGSGGYYSELIASRIAPNGKVLLINNKGFEAWGINILNDRFTDRDPGDIDRILISGIELDLKPDSIDAALIVMALHDLYVTPKRYNGESYVPVEEPANAAHFLEQVYSALRPGGRFVIVDHAGRLDMAAEAVFDLHRMPETFAKTEVMKHGFRFISADPTLRNPQDDQTQIVFDPEVKGQTDRFILVFEKP